MRKKLFGLAVRTMFVWFTVSNIYAAKYWVATDGDDKNPGSEVKPSKTIQKAANTAQAGDTVYINPGTYSGII